MTRVPEELLVHLRRAKDTADREYAEPLDLDGLAATAGVSKYHFLRCFAATYGKTPALYLTERRIERAQDLLRATNLTVTEVCHRVGYTSLGSVQLEVPRPRRRVAVRVPGEVRRRRAAHSPAATCSCTGSATAGRFRNFGEAISADPVVG